jgi:hypothetical protein
VTDYTFTRWLKVAHLLPDDAPSDFLADLRRIDLSEMQSFADLKTWLRRNWASDEADLGCAGVIWWRYRMWKQVRARADRARLIRMPA